MCTSTLGELKTIGIHHKILRQIEDNLSVVQQLEENLKTITRKSGPTPLNKHLGKGTPGHTFALHSIWAEYSLADPLKNHSHSLSFVGK